MTSIAFHNDTALAARVRAQIDAHTAADEIVQGRYWENGKGCFIGCIAHSDDTSAVEALTGFPIMLQRIAESIFEGLPNDVAKGFPQRVINAPKPGADISLVAWKFLHIVAKEALDTHGTEEVRAGCAAAVAVLADKAHGKPVSSAAARAAAYAANAAARAAARAAAYAAYAAGSAAADAADVAADAAARATYAADAARMKQADLLVKLLTECGN